MSWWFNKMIVKINNKIIFQNDEPFELDISNDTQNKIDEIWNQFIKNKKGYWNGDIYLANDLDLDKGIIKINKTKYASLVYAKEQNDLQIRALFCGILFTTLDNKYVIIKNNHDKINIIGGMADNEDFIDHKFNPNHCLKREVLEEIGLDIDNKKQVIDYSMEYLKVPESSENYYPVGIIYLGRLNYTSQEFIKYLDSHQFDNEIKYCYFYTADELLQLQLQKNDISYLKDLIKMENDNNDSCN